MTAAASVGKRNLLANASVNWIGFAAQIGLAFFLSPLLVHGLGNRRYGTWSLVESVLAYMTLFDLGVAASVVRYVAKFEACHDFTRLNKVFTASLGIFGVVGLMVLGVALGFAFCGSTPLGVPDDLASDTRWLLVLLGLNLALGMAGNVFTAVLEGLGRYPAKTIIRTCGLVLRSLLMLLALHAGYGLPVLAGITTVCNLLEYCFIIRAVYRYLPELRLVSVRGDGATFRTIAGYSLNALLAMLAGRISFQTDAIVIGAFLAPQHITFFILASRLVDYGKESLRVVTGVLTSAISALEGRGDQAAIRSIFLNGTRYVLFFAVLLQMGLWSLGKPFLTLWLGRELADQSYPTLVILSLSLTAAMAQTVAARILYGVGQLRWFSRWMMGEALCNLMLSLVLVRPYGIEGVAWGTALPNLLFSLGVAAYVCGLLGIRLHTYAQRALLKPLALAPLPVLIWTLARLTLDPSSWSALILIGLLGVVSYASAAILVEWGPRAVLTWLQGGLQGGFPSVLWTSASTKTATASPPAIIA